MRKISVEDLKNINLFKHYRIIRKWASKTCNIKEADLELLMYLDGIGMFKKQDFKEGVIDIKTKKRKPFFKYGPENNWKNGLDLANRKKIEKNFKKEMLELKYL